MKSIMSLPIEERYGCLSDLCERQFNGNCYKTAAFVGCSVNTVKNAVNRIRYPGPFAKHGPEPKLKAHHLLFIEIETELDHYITNKQLAEKLVQRFQDIDKCSENTVRTARKSLGLKYSPPRQIVKLNEQARRKRIEWCNRHMLNGTTFENVIFSDESWFEFGRNRRWLWRRKDDFSPSVCVERQAHPPKVMIWGAIGKNFKSKLIFIEGSVTADLYFDEIILGSNLLEDADRVYGMGNGCFSRITQGPTFQMIQSNL